MSVLRVWRARRAERSGCLACWMFKLGMLVALPVQQGQGTGTI